VYGDGGNVRDWLHAEDHCRALDLILARGRPGEVYNIGGHAELANLALVRELCRVLDARFAAAPALRTRFPKSPAAQGKTSASLIGFVTDRLGHDRRYAIDSRKIERELGFQPRHEFATGLGATVDWYLERRR